MGYYLKPPAGMGLNPLAKSKYGNMIYPCGSMKKAKKCCGRYTYMKNDLIKQVEIYLKSGYGMDREELKARMKHEKQKAEEESKNEQKENPNS